MADKRVFEQLLGLVDALDRGDEIVAYRRAATIAALLRDTNDREKCRLQNIAILRPTSPLSPKDREMAVRILEDFSNLAAEGHS